MYSCISGFIPNKQKHEKKMKPKNMKQTAVFFVACFFSMLSLAQTHNKQVKSLNRYVDFINETIHSLWMMHGELDKINADLLAIYNDKDVKPHFENKDVLNMASAYKLPPGEIYEKCLADTTLPEIDKIILDNSLKAMMRTIKAIELQRDAMDKYINKKKYKDDANLETGFAILKHCEKLYDSYSRQKEKFFEQIERVYKKFEPKIAHDPYLRVSEKMREVIDQCRLILKASRERDYPTNAPQHDQLYSNIAGMMDNKEKYTKGLRDFDENNGLTPSYRYDRFIAEANAFYTHSQNYFTKRRFSSPFTEESKLYFYFNQQFLNKFNRYGGGVIFEYNLFIALADFEILRQVEEPHWFVAVLPEKLNIKNAIDTIAPPMVEKDDYIEPDTMSLRGFLPNNLVLLLDVSGSMDNPYKLPLLKRAFKYLLSLMRPEDYVSIVSYSGRAKVELKPTSATEKESISTVIENLESGGNTDLQKGLRLSYKTAVDNFMEKGNNRIILATDGSFSIDEKVFDKVQKYARNNEIALTIFYLSKYENRAKAEELERLAKTGNGNYIHVTTENAEKVLLKEAQSLTE